MVGISAEAWDDTRLRFLGGNPWDPDLFEMRSGGKEHDTRARTLARGRLRVGHTIAIGHHSQQFPLHTRAPGVS